MHRDQGLPVLILRTSRFFPEGDDRDDVRTAFDDANLKVNELLYRRVDIEDVVESVGELAEGHVTVRDIEAMCEVAVTTPGVCAGMGTANTMHAMAEALGMTLPGTAGPATARRPGGSAPHRSARRAPPAPRPRSWS